jgi:hypothetical protein
MARTWRNYTDLDDALLRRIYHAVCPAGLRAHDVSFKNYGSTLARGMAYSKGSALHGSARPFVVVSIARTEKAARGIFNPHGVQPGYLPDIAVGNRLECAVYVLAHELRHLWQSQTGAKRQGMIWGSRGRMSERDADAYGVRMLRRWRRGELIP